MAQKAASRRQWQTEREYTRRAIQATGITTAAALPT